MINKIDLISARPDEVAEEISSLLGTPADEIVRISAKEGLNVEAGAGSGGEAGAAAQRQR